MPEAQPNQTPNTSTPQTPGTTIDLSKFLLSTPTPETNPLANETPKTNTANNIMNQLKVEEKKADIEMWHIVIADAQGVRKEVMNLGDSGIWSASYAKTFKNNYIKIILASYAVIVISLIGMGIINIRNKYLDSVTAAEPDANYSIYVDKRKVTTKRLSEMTNIDDYAVASADTSFMLSEGESKVPALINNSRLNYPQKKDILENGIHVFMNDLQNTASQLQVIKKQATEYGYLPEEIFPLLSKPENITNIKRAILLIEDMKYITALKYFSYLPSFFQTISNDLGGDPGQMQTKIQQLVEDGEKPIIAYTNMCYLNPYEDNNCQTIDDLTNYYRWIQSDIKIDIPFLKKTISYIEQKLMQKDIPSITITFPAFDPRQTNLSFGLDINTMKSDETTLIQQGMTNPHLTIVTNLLYMLKESLLVVGESIRADTIKPSTKSISIKSTTFTVNNSTFSFSLPIQKTLQREITDTFTPSQE